MNDEIELMFRVKEGQLDKLALLYEGNKVSLYNFFLRSGNSPALSEDLVQETFMKVLAYRSGFQGSSTFKSWLYGIARNTQADYYRKSSNKKIHNDIDDHEQVEEQTLGEQFEQVEQHKLFEASLNKLPPEHRDLIVLSRFQQLNYQEIADMLDCNLNTLKARIRKAISTLQQCYTSLTGEGRS